MYTTYLSSPLGMLKLTANETHLVQLDFIEEKELSTEISRQSTQIDSNVIRQTLEELKEYFDGKRRDFTIPIAFERGTEFQRDVWAELSKIPYAQVITYGEQSKRIGREKACRAVGMTNGKNPIAIIVPCHRVIGANGKLTGYASGIWRKEWLLNHERSNAL